MSRRDGAIVAWHSQQHLAKACCEMSRRDGAIVAWPGGAGDSGTPKKPARRVRWDSCKCAHRYEDLSGEISNTKTEKLYVVCDLLKNHGAHIDEKCLWD